jgi:hypothetical protein
MPFLSKLSHRRRYVEGSATAQKLADIRILLSAVRSLEIGKALKKRMLVHGIWEVARATGDFCGRYRSETVIRFEGCKIQRDHIYQKSTLVEQLLGASPDIDSIMDRARCCIVTAEEHEKLHRLQKNFDGWDRYRAAGVAVYDMQSETRVT